MDSSESSGLEGLGNAILEQRIRAEQAGIDAPVYVGRKSQLYGHMIELSEVLKETRLPIEGNQIIDNQVFDRVMALVNALYNDLALAGRAPSLEIGPNSSTVDAYGILCYALLALRNRDSGIQEKYDELIESLGETSAINDLYQSTLSAKMTLENENSELREQLAAVEAELESEVRQMKSLSVEEVDNYERRIQEAERETQKLKDVIQRLESENQEQMKVSADLKLEIQQQKRVNDGLEHELQSQRNRATIPVVQIESDEPSPQVFVLETEVALLKKKIEDLREENKQQLDVIRELKAEMAKLDNEKEEVKLELEHEKMANDKLVVTQEVVDDSEVKRLRQDLEMKEAETANLKLALAELSKQMEEMNNELSEQSAIRNDVIGIVHRQSTALLEMEKLTKPVESKVEMTNKYVQVGNLSENVKKEPVVVQPVVEEKVVKAERTPDERYDRLMQLLSNTVSFLGQIGDSDELQKCLFGTAQQQEFKHLLKGQCTRIDAFMSENGYDNRVSQDIDIDSATEDELRMLVMQSQAVNSILVSHSNELRNQAEFLLSEVKRLKFQLADLKGSMTEEMHEDALVYRDQIARHEEYLEGMRSVLRQKPKDFILTGRLKARFIANATDILKQFCDECQQAVDSCGSITALSQQIEDNCSALISRLNGLIPERANVVSRLEIHKAFVNLLLGQQPYEDEEEEDNNSSEPPISIQQENEIERLKNRTKKWKRRCNDEKKSAAELALRVQEKEKEISSLKNSIASLTNKLNTLQCRFQEEGVQFEELKAIQQAQFEESEKSFNRRVAEILREKDEAISQCKSEHDHLLQQLQIEFSQKKQEMKQEISDLSAQVLRCQDHAKSVKAHYESIVDELKNKWNSAKEAESVAISQYRQCEMTINELKSEAVSLKVEARVLDAKLKTEAEKFERQKSMMLAKNKLQMMELETDYEKRVDALTGKLERQFSDFLVEVCEKFRDFYDFANAITKDSVICMLDMALKAYRDSSNENERVRDILDMGSSGDVTQRIESILAELQQLKHENEEIKSDAQKTPKVVKLVDQSWQMWGSRLASLVTGKLIVGRNEKEVQNIIEEALLDSFGNRNLWQKVDILRCEKKLLETGVAKVQRNTFFIPSLKTILCTCVSVMRMQRLSGHMKCMLAVQRPSSEEPVEQSPCSGKRKTFPILSIAGE